MIIQIGTKIDESRILWKHKESDKWKRADIDDLIEAYEGRPTGEWIDVSGGWCPNEECSLCGEIVHEYNYNYCPNCGAQMKRLK